MEHYVCEGCQGASDTAGVCTTPACENQGKDLGACNCEGGTASHGKESTDSSAGGDTPAM